MCLLSAEFMASRVSAASFQLENSSKENSIFGRVDKSDIHDN